MEDRLTRNKTLNIISSIVLSLFMAGLGQIACGKLIRGISLYILFQAIFIAAFFIALQPFPPFNILAAVGIIFSTMLFIVIDSILIARNPDNSLKLKPLIGYSLLIFISIVNSSFVQPFISQTIKDNYAQTFQIPAGSMLPSLMIGDYILVNKQAYKNMEPKRGDIVVFDFEADISRTYIRRVIGVGGDLIQIKNKELYINDKIYNENYVLYSDFKSLPDNRQPIDNYGPVSIPKGSYFLLGDNRNNSYDSRYWGLLAADKIKGKAATIYWSWDKQNREIRWDRIGKPINEP